LTSKFQSAVFVVVDLQPCKSLLLPVYGICAGNCSTRKL